MQETDFKILELIYSKRRVVHHLFFSALRSGADVYGVSQDEYQQACARLFMHSLVTEEIDSSERYVAIRPKGDEIYLKEKQRREDANRPPISHTHINDYSKKVVVEKGVGLIDSPGATVKDNFNKGGKKKKDIWDKFNSLSKLGKTIITIIGLLITIFSSITTYKIWTKANSTPIKNPPIIQPK